MRTLYPRLSALCASFFILTFGLLLTSCEEKPDQSPIPPEYEGVNSIMSQRFGGRDRAILLLIENGQVVYERSYGKINHGHRLNIGTASTWPAAVVALNLVDRGVIRLNDPLKNYSPYQDVASGDATIRQLLAQTSGLPPTHDCLTNLLSDNVACGLGIAANTPRFIPGAFFELGYGSYQVIGGIAKASFATYPNWQELHRDVLKNPMQLANFDYEYGEYFYLPNARIADGLYSTVSDFARFMVMIASGGVHNGEQIVSPQSLREMFTDQIGIVEKRFASDIEIGDAAADLRDYRYGLGVWIEERKPDGSALVVSNPGSFGFIPWINLETKNGGVLVVPGKFSEAWEAYRLVRSELGRIGK